MTQPSKKLSNKFLGPYEVLAQPGTHLVTLQLPNSLQDVHPVFHVLMLEPTHPNLIPNQVQPPPLAIMVDDETKFEISEILDSKINNRCHACKLLYLVQWTGYKGTDKETSWILMTKLGHATELVSDLHSAYPGRPGPFSLLLIFFHPSQSPVVTSKFAIPMFLGSWDEILFLLFYFILCLLFHLYVC